MNGPNQPKPVKRSLVANFILAGYLIFGAFCGSVMATSPNLGLLAKLLGFVFIVGMAWVIFLAHETIWHAVRRALAKAR